MKFFKNKIIYLLPLICMLLLGNMIIINVNAEVYGDWEYEIVESEEDEEDEEDDTLIITNYKGQADTVDIPSVINGKTVTEIGDFAFFENSFTTITIPDTITTVGGWAFEECDKLTNVTIPDSVDKIGKGLFADCTNLKEVKLSANMYTITDLMFNNCTSLKSINIPESVTSIGDGAFSGCSSLTEISIPANVWGIGYYPFSKCSNLTSIKVSNDNTHFNDGNGSNVIISTAGKVICAGCTKSVIPDGVEVIGEYAFSEVDGLGDIVLPNSLREIEGSTFENCSGLTSVTIPDSVENIGYNAFENCKDLVTVNIPKNLSKISDGMFKGCESINAITIPDGITEIGHCAFDGCTNLKEIIIPDSVTNIRYGAFHYCKSLTEIAIPANVTSIGELGDSVSYWGSTGSGEELNVFEDCSSLKSIKVSSDNKVYNDGNGSNAIIITETNNLITGCQTTVIPSTVTRIEKSAFYGCSELESITIPDSVTEMGSYVFDGCDKLKTVWVYRGSYADKWVNDSWNAGNYTIRYVGEPEQTDGKNDDSATSSDTDTSGNNNNGGQNGTNNTSNNSNTNNNGSSASNANNSNGNTSSGTTTIKPADKGKSLTVPGAKATFTVTSSDAANPTVAFSGITDKKAKSVTIPEKITVDNVTYRVTSVADKALSGNKKIKKVTIPKGVTSIGKNAFNNCKNLKNIVIKSTTLKSVGKNAIKGIDKKAVIKAPKKQLKAYKKLFAKKTGYKKTMKIKK